MSQTRQMEYNTDLAQFISDYYQIEGTSRKDPALEIAMAYIESCLVTEGVTGEMLKVETERLIPQINYYR